MNTQTDKSEPQSESHAHLIHIEVEVDGKNRPATLDHTPASGAEIRSAAGAPATDDLSRLIHNKPSGGNIGLGDMVPIENGDRFIAIATGTVS